MLFRVASCCFVSPRTAASVPVHVYNAPGVCVRALGKQWAARNRFQSVEHNDRAFARFLLAVRSVARLTRRPINCPADERPALGTMAAQKEARQRRNGRCGGGSAAGTSPRRRIVFSESPARSAPTGSPGPAPGGGPHPVTRVESYDFESAFFCFRPVSRRAPLAPMTRADADGA